MKEVINAFTAQFDYPADARRALAEGYERLCADPEASALFHSYVDAYERDEFRDYGGALTALYGGMASLLGWAASYYLLDSCEPS